MVVNEVRWETDGPQKEGCDEAEITARKDGWKVETEKERKKFEKLYKFLKMTQELRNKTDWDL